MGLSTGLGDAAATTVLAGRHTTTYQVRRDVPWGVRNNNGESVVSEDTPRKIREQETNGGRKFKTRIGAAALTSRPRRRGSKKSFSKGAHERGSQRGKVGIGDRDGSQLQCRLVCRVRT